MKHGTIKAGSVPFCFSMGELLDEETCAKYNIQLVPFDPDHKLLSVDRPIESGNVIDVLGHTFF